MSALRKSAPIVSIVVAMSAKNRAIGKEGKLLWHISEDLKRFKRLTERHPVIMGRKTFDSIVGYLNGPLPERTNIVVTRNPRYIYEHDDVIVSPSLEDALESAREIDQEEIFIGGGSELYKQALPFTNRLYLTLIYDEKEADTFFPPYADFFTKKLSEETHATPSGLKYTWLDLEKENT